MAGLKVERVDDGGQQNLSAKPVGVMAERAKIEIKCLELDILTTRGALTGHEVARQERILSYLKTVDSEVLRSVVKGLLESGCESSGLVKVGLLALGIKILDLRKAEDPILLSSDIYAGRLLDLLNRH